MTDRRFLVPAVVLVLAVASCRSGPVVVTAHVVERPRPTPIAAPPPAVTAPAEAPPASPAPAAAASAEPAPAPPAPAAIAAAPTASTTAPPAVPVATAPAVAAGQTAAPVSAAAPPAPVPPASASPLAVAPSPASAGPAAPPVSAPEEPAPAPAPVVNPAAAPVAPVALAAPPTPVAAPPAPTSPVASTASPVALPESPAAPSLPAAPPPAAPLTTALAARTGRAVPRYPIPQLVGVEGLYGLSISADNRQVLVSSDRSGVFNAWAIPLDGGAPTALTASGDSIFVDSYFPRDQRVLYTADRGGDEQSHVYLRDLDGQIRDLTPGTNLKASFLDWSGDGRSFFILTNERDPRYFDLYEYGGFGRQRVWQNDQGFDIAAVSPDKRWLALTRETTTNDSDVWVYDTQSKELRNLTAHAGVVRNDPQTFSADSSRLYLTSNAEGEFADLVRVDLASGQRQTVLRAGWDVVAARLSRDRRFIVVQVNADARTQLELLDAQTLRPTNLPALANFAITQVELSRDGSLMAFYAEGSNEPRNLFVYEFASGKVRKLTNSLGDIPAADLVPAEVVRYASLDGLTVPALLYRPLSADASHPVAAVVVVHGGPGGQSRAQYSDLVQVLTNAGYAVLAVNNRGSSGYGKTFYGLDDRHHGEGDLDDCVAGRRWLASQDWVAADRIGIVGGSYGGFMTLAALAFRPTEFAVGVDLYGVANWPRTLASMPAWWGSARDAILAELGDPATDGERLRRISPLFHTEGIVRPLLVLQGANDPRVLPAESDEIVAALRARSVPVEYVKLADEGHGFVKRSSTEHAYAAIVGFLDRYLGAASQAAAN